jgi:hypothetical protein
LACHDRQQVPSGPPDLFGPGRPSHILNIGRRCRFCTGESFLTGPGCGPHAARLTCVSCGAFAGWLPRVKAEALARRATGEMAGGAALAAFGGVGWGRTPKWAREMERADRFSPDKSHAGMAPWAGAAAGAGGGAYLGNELVGDRGALPGAALGGVLGGGFGVAGLMRYIRQIDEMERAAVAARPATGGGAVPVPVRPPLAQRLRELEPLRQVDDAVRAARTPADDLAGPLPNSGGPATRMQGGRRITQDSAGRWRDGAGRHVEQPGSGPLTEGFGDTWTADLERAVRRRPEPGPVELAGPTPAAPTGAHPAETMAPPPGAPPGGRWIYQSQEGYLRDPAGTHLRRGWRKD